MSSIPKPRLPSPGSIPGLNLNVKQSSVSRDLAKDKADEPPALTEEEQAEKAAADDEIRDIIIEQIGTAKEKADKETALYGNQVVAEVDKLTSVTTMDGTRVSGKELVDNYTVDGKVDTVSLAAALRVNQKLGTAEIEAAMGMLDIYDEAQEKSDDLGVAKEAAEDKEKWDLEDLAHIFVAAAAGFGIWETVAGLNADDDPALDVKAEMRKAVEANTDPYTRELITNAAYGDQAALADLENITRYGNQFGSLSSDMFNGEYGEFFEQDYQRFLTEIEDSGGDSSQYDRDRYLREFARDNPTHEASQLINESMSRLGQLKRSSEELAELDRSLMRTGYEDAAKFYKPRDQGGWGFEPDDFRTGEQKTLLDYAMGLTEDTYERYQQKGELEPDTLRKLSADSLTSVDPALQSQQYFGGGGIAKSVLNTSEAKRKRMFEDEAAFATNVGATNQMAKGMTVDPAGALGLTGQGNWGPAGSQLETGAQGYDYGNTNFYSGILANNLGIAQANASKDPASTSLDDIGQNLKTLQEQIDKLNT